MRNKENIEIDGVNYICTMMPATMANKVLVELVDAVGRPALMAAATGFDGSGMSGLDTVVDVGTKMLMERVTPESADRVCKLALHGVMAEGVKGDLFEDKYFDAHFQGRILHLWKVVSWSIKVNYGDFFCAAHSNPTVSSLVSTMSSGLNTLTAILSSGDAASSETH